MASKGWNLLVLGLSLLIFPAKAAEKGPQLLIGFKPSASGMDRAVVLKNSSEAKTLATAKSGRQSNLPAPLKVALVTLREGIGTAAEIARLEQNPAVEFVEPNYPLKLFNEPAGRLPDDFEFARQYSLRNLGANGAKTNADIRASTAWAYTTGSKSVVVAVIDTGIDYFHEDLADNIWVNRDEVPANGIDDDGNGYIDDVFGYDIVSDDSDPFDDNNHGTHVAGIIAAKGNNGVGVAGVCWEASLMAIKAFDQDGNGTVADAIAAIHYAVENGAHLINASWGINEKSRALEEAAQFAADRGVLIIAAAGNERTDSPAYPASFESVLSVAASDAMDNRAIFSNYGPTVDLAAPGADIFSTLPENQYGIASGTSMAAPHVTGVAALVLSRFPNYSREELFDILINSVDPVLFDFAVGSGRLNASIAVKMDQPLPVVRLNVPATLSTRREILGSAFGTYFSGFLLRAGAGTYPTNWVELAVSSHPVTNNTVGVFDSSLIPDGTATIQLVVSNQNGSIASASASVRLLNGLINEPAAGDILRPGKYPVRGTVYGARKTYEVAYGAGLSPTNWIRIASGLASDSTNVLLGEWDASHLPSGLYALRLTIDDGDTNKFEFNAPAIYIDQELKEGWPAYIPVDSDFPPSDWRNVRVADLDGDLLAELVLVDPGTRSRPQRLWVFNPNGRVLWSRELGYDIPPDLPAIGDTDGDGRLEIFVDSTNGITAFRHDGEPLDGWPIQTERGNHAKVLADLDGDGRLELIAYSQEYSATQVAETRELAVYRGDGALARKWELPWCGFTNNVQKIFPAVANIDEDPELEIVVVSGCREVAAYDYRSAQPKWRAHTSASIITSPVIGDIDGRGGPDVVVACAFQDREEGGIYIFNGKGERWLGWPVLEDHSFTASPALGDLDRDGRLEIIIPSLKPAGLHVVQWDGFEAEGWPRDLRTVTWHNNVAAADMNGDGLPDAVLTAPGYMNLVVTLGEIRYAGGISAFTFEGEEISLSGNSLFKPRLIESTTGRWHRSGPAVIGDMDSDGRMDLVTASVLDRTYGSYLRFKNRSSIYAWDLGLPSSPEALPWPMFGHDSQNTGAYSLPMVPIPPPTNATLAIRDRVLTVEDHPVEIQPLLNDWNAAGGNLTLASFGQPTNGVVTRVNDSTLLYTPKLDYSGFDGFNYVIADAAGRTSTGRVVVRTKSVNDPPVAKPLEFSMTKNTSLNIYFSAEDAENESLTYRVFTTPSNGEVWNYPTVGFYYPRKGFHGIDTFTYVASDGKNESAPATITITVINSNNPPKAFPIELLTKTNRAVSIFAQGQDPDGDPLTFEIVRKPVNGTVLMEGNVFKFTPDKDYVGEESFTYRPFDGTEFGEPALVKVGVIRTNATPRALHGSATVHPNTTSDLFLSGSDPDGDSIEFTLLSQPLHGQLNGTPPHLKYTPEKDYEGPDRFTFTVSDTFAESEPATYTITVSRQNRPPESRDQALRVFQNSSLAFLLDAYDPDSDPVRTVILKGPANGRIYGAGTNFVYTPRAAFAGSDHFTYKLWDGQKFGKQAVVEFRVASGEPAETLSIESFQRRGEAVELVVRSDRAFSVQVSSDLRTWSVLAGPITPSAQATMIIDSAPTPQKRFYRVVADD